MDHPSILKWSLLHYSIHILFIQFLLRKIADFSHRPSEILKELYEKLFSLYRIHELQPNIFSMFWKTGSPWVYFTSRAFQGYITEHTWKGVFWLSAVLELPTDWFYKDGSSFIHSALLEYIIYFRNCDNCSQRLRKIICYLCLRVTISRGKSN